MRIQHLVISRSGLVGGILVLLVSASASAQNFSAPTWLADVTSPENTCQTALNTALDYYRGVYSDPLIVIGPDCAQAALSGPLPNFNSDFRRPFDFPTTSNRQIHISAQCTP